MNLQQIQTDKLDLIGWIYNIQDISIIEELKIIQKKTVLRAYEASLKPMSEKELINRAKNANKAIKNNKVILQDDLKKETENW